MIRAVLCCVKRFITSRQIYFSLFKQFRAGVRAAAENSHGVSWCTFQWVVPPNIFACGLYVGPKMVSKTRSNKCVGNYLCHHLGSEEH